MEFLSVRNLEIHKEYYNDLKLKYSVFEKSYVELKGKTLNDIPRCRIRSEERKKAFLLRAEIDAHELFFSSFKNRNTVCPQINKEWGSLQNFLYTIFRASIETEGKFLLIYKDLGKIKYSVDNNYAEILKDKNPILALDLCEHSYFLDYGFDKRAYVENALSYFDFSTI